jgi:hypothetical protein
MKCTRLDVLRTLERAGMINDGTGRANYERRKEN